MSSEYKVVDDDGVWLQCRALMGLSDLGGRRRFENGVSYKIKLDDFLKAQIEGRSMVETADVQSKDSEAEALAAAEAKAAAEAEEAAKAEMAALAALAQAEALAAAEAKAAAEAEEAAKAAAAAKKK